MHYNTKYHSQTLKLIKEYESFKPVKKEFKSKLDKKLRLEFNFNSNHIEGNTLTYGQTEMLLHFDKSIGDALVSDIEQMKAHDLALNLIKTEASSQHPLTEKFIKELNRTILVRPFWKEAVSDSGIPTKKRIEIGTYKSTPNSVKLANGEIHEYASPVETPSKMYDLMEWFRSQDGTLSPIQLAAELHYRFVCIHPFDDGNGRVARLLMNYVLFKENIPPIIIKSEDKTNYLTALQKADTGNIEAIINYIEKQALYSLNLAINAAKGLSIEERGDIDKEIELLKREKLTKTTIYNSPKVSFELLQHLEETVWERLCVNLQKFDAFFGETSTSLYLNNFKNEKTLVKKGLRSIIQPLENKEVTVIPYLFHKHNLEEKLLSSVSWKKHFISLKSASSKVDLFILFRVEFHDPYYTIELSMSTNHNPRSGDLFKKATLLQQEKKYSQFLNKDDEDSLVSVVSEALLNRIKILD